jgi:hypothetical protein
MKISMVMKFIKKNSILPISQIDIQKENINTSKTNKSYMYIKPEPLDKQLKLMEEGKIQHTLIIKNDI